jgi:hypothetical protein
VAEKNIPNICGGDEELERIVIVRVDESTLDHFLNVTHTLLVMAEK